MTLSEQEKKDWIRLALSEHVGPVTFRHLLSYYGSAGEALRHIGEIAHRGGRKKPMAAAPEKAADAQLRRAAETRTQILFSCEKNYPELLKSIPDAPPLLFVRGNPVLFEKKAIGIVGTRNASLNGKNLAHHFAMQLGKQDFVIVSGMAKGIDRAAHEGALKNTAGGTIAVLGTPADEIYPAENTDIYNTIAERGCLVSELPFGTPLSPGLFPRRNRLISGLSRGVLIIEAQTQSGSLITAREALDQGREVFAIPGSPLDPRSAGPNALIQDGARLVTQPADITDVLTRGQPFHLEEETAAASYQPAPVSDDELTACRAVILERLGAERTAVDTLIQETDIPARLVNIILVELELAGRLERHPGNRISLLFPTE